nr:MAG TPA: hypothetical protein [Caudoviricetes sp.]
MLIYKHLYSLSFFEPNPRYTVYLGSFYNINIRRKLWPS